MQRWAVLLAALWWGGLTGLSFVAVPMLFASLGNPALAGPVAAQLFAVQCWAGLVLGLGLLLLLRQPRSRPDAHTMTTLGLVLAAMLVAVVQELGVAHQIVTARASGGNLRLWHSIGSVMVLAQWVCAGAVLWRLSGPPRSGF
jgi:hypothetical protein